jgi:hypothetical protein
MTEEHIDVTEAKISDFEQDPRNANRGTERGGELLAESLRELRAGRSILVDKNGTIIAGNKTARAAIEAGLTDAIIVPTDGSKLVVVQRTDLDLETDQQATRLAILDNRVSQVDLEWDPTILKAISEEQPEVIAGVFEAGELARILGEESEEEEKSAPKKKRSAKREVTIKCPHCGHDFELEEIVSLRQ